MTEIAKWDGFFVIVGSAAGALIGLQFVAMSLLAQRPLKGAAEAGAAFGSPVVVHFGAALFLAALMHAPWQSMTSAAVVWGALGFGCLAYSMIVCWRMRRQRIYEPVFEDWLFHAILPLSAYSILGLSAIAAPFHARVALFGVGGASLLLLYVGIHNAWDNVSYHVLIARTDKQKQPNDEIEK